MEYRTGIPLMGRSDRALSPDFFVVKGRLARAFITQRALATKWRPSPSCCNTSSLFASICVYLTLKTAWRLVVKVRDVIKLVEADGWYHVGTRGDHRQYKHPIKKGRVTIPGHPSDEMKPYLYNSVLKQAQIKRRR